MSFAALENFAVDNFAADKFVKDLSSKCIGADELRLQRAKIQELADNTSASLKQNVYQNYIQFIETAKEISHLESEMYQLSQLLSEQRSLLSTLDIRRSSNVLLQNETPAESENVSDQQKEDEVKKKLTKLLENVEGALTLVETPGRLCLHEGTLQELDPIDGKPMKKIRAYLFNDILMTASELPYETKKGQPRYRMQVVYEIQSLAVVNVKDRGSVNLAFKLLAFPDTRVFQCSSATSKKEWLESCEQAKRLKLCQGNLPNDNNKEPSPKLERAFSMSMSTAEEENHVVSYAPLPDWILEISESLDSFIAQRHFEEAYDLLQKATSFLQTVEASPQILKEMQGKCKERSNYLISILTKELESTMEIKSLQGGGLRSAKRAVKLLIKLDRSAKACQLFLKLCSATLKTRLRKIKREGAIVHYVKQLSAIAFKNIAEMSQEFFNVFSGLPHCNSAFAVWCSHELKTLTCHIIKQIFIPQVSLSTIVDCIITLREDSEQLTQIGLDYRYQLDAQIRAPLSKILRETKEKYVEAIKLRASEENWNPSNFQTPQNADKVLMELDDIGIPLPENLIKNKYIIPLTNNTLTFAKMYIGLLEDCLNLATPEMIVLMENLLISILQVQLEHFQASMRNPKFKQKRNLIQDNAKYIKEVIIARSIELHKSVTGHQFRNLLILQKQFSMDSPGSPREPQPAPRISVQKYSTTEYI
ncbi:hypothetical protein TKK_0001206 [Trichogramma kaykai]|uniref:Exocyst complex component 8 n=1 Tax=Trichogramma kaykai TaxID=54128 RepID=A0ABD2WWJ6_9HYME